MFHFFADISAKIAADGYGQSLEQSTKYIQILSDQLREQYANHFDSISCITIPYTTYEAIESALQYELPDEIPNKDLETHIILDQVAENPQKRLTLSEAIALLSLLVSIFFGILQLLPDEQLEVIADQSKLQTEQTEELVNSLNNIGNGIYLLTEEIDALREEVEDLNNLLELSDKENAETPQEQNSNSQQ